MGSITAEEISQMFIANRTFDLIDLSCSYLGIIGGDIAVRSLQRKRDDFITDNSRRT